MPSCALTPHAPHSALLDKDASNVLLCVPALAPVLENLPEMSAAREQCRGNPYILDLESQRIKVPMLQSRLQSGATPPAPSSYEAPSSVAFS